MNKFLVSCVLTLLLLFLNYSLSCALGIHTASPERFSFAGGKHMSTTAISNQHPAEAHPVNNSRNTSSEEEYHHAPAWMITPFVLLLLMIATGPLFYEHFWHKNYPKISVLLATIVIAYYMLALHNTNGPIHALIEYVPFISLLSALYIASGGISIYIDKKATPLANLGLLSVGAVIANIIGTTGASMLLIRPFVRLNRNRIRSYHIIFFIFIVSNIGGSLTPIGDPPLFLGFLKGVPFEWTMNHNLLPWVFACTLLCTIFYLFDIRNKDTQEDPEEAPPTYSGKITIEGSKNFIWLGLVIMAVFLDPNVFDWVPGINYDGVRISYIKEAIWVVVAFCSYRFASKKAIADNDFSFEPIKEVAFLFIGIFATMMPAIELVGNFASSEEGSKLITHNTLYWGTGLLSGLLDNAPTYINFLTAAMASKGSNISVMSEVIEFANGGLPQSILYLKAIAVSAVFFGAMTYIGNGPNFMVKSIAEQIGIKMPSFFGYIIRFSIPVLLPVLFIVWLIFFAFH